MQLEQLQRLQREMMSQGAPDAGVVPTPLTPNGTAPTPVTSAPVPAPESQSMLLDYLSKAAAAASANVRSEIDRICDLPIEETPSPEVVELCSRHYCPECTWDLMPEQAKAMIQYHKYRGGFVPIKVGGGKSLIVCLIASDAYSDYNIQRIVILCPSNLVGQLRKRELPKYRRHISINVPFTFLSDLPRDRRLSTAQSGRSGAFVIPYSLLSSRYGSEILDALRPELIIGDEIHCVTSIKNTARTRRFKEVVDKYDPELVGLSGTITKKKILEYHYLATHALKEHSFLPRTLVQAEAWGKMIDSDAEGVPVEQGGGPIEPLIEWLREYNGESVHSNVVGFRRAFRVRTETCPGVTASDETELGVSLNIHNVPGDRHAWERAPGWQELQDYVTRVTQDWITPDGDEIDYAIHLWKWRYELEGFGFYNSLYWPEVELIQHRKQITASQAQMLLDASKAYHEAGQEYHRQLRTWLQYNGRQGLDTPMLVGGDMLRNGDANVGSTLFNVWNEWRDLKYDDLIDRDSKVVRVCPFRVNDVIAWAKAHHKKHPDEGAIIWYKHHGVGDWLDELFKDSGLPYIHAVAGNTGSELLEDPANRPYFCLTAIGTGNAGHFQGHNCQHWGYQYFAQWPREAHIAEQAIGRIHREKQMRDDVTIYTNISSAFDQVLFSACLNDAAYMHQTMGAHKLIYADYNYTPRILPYAVLKEWGTDPKRLTKRMQELMEETFDVGEVAKL